MAINNTVENINNQPTIQPRTVTGIFTKYIAKTLPLAFDESMSYYECLCALLEYLNETIVPDINNTNEGLEELQGFYIDLQNYVNTYFDNLDVQEEINNKLDEMAENGSLTQLIKNYVDPIQEEFENEINQEFNDYKDDVNSHIATMNTKINNITSGTPIPVSSVEAMTDTTRIYLNTTNGYWYYYNGSAWTQGDVYQSTGISTSSVTYDSLEHQLKNSLEANYTNDVESYQSGWVNNSGEIQTSAQNSQFYVTKELEGNDILYYKGSYNTTYMTLIQNLYIIFDENDEIIDKYPITTAHANNDLIEVLITCPPLARKIMFNTTYVRSNPNVPCYCLLELTSFIQKDKITYKQLSDSLKTLFTPNYEAIEKSVFIPNAYLDSNMNPHGYSNWNVYKYSVTPGETLKVKHLQNIYNNPIMFFGSKDVEFTYTFNDIDYEFDFRIDSYPESPQGGTGYLDDFTINVPDYCTTLYVTAKSDNTTFDVCRVSNYLVNADETTIDFSNIESNPLKNKKLCFAGDSIMAATTNGVKGWVGIMSENNPNTSFYNYGHDGYTIAKAEDSWSSRSIQNVLPTILTEHSDTDYIIFQGGANDYWGSSHGITLGEISSGFNPNNFDRTTFCGGMEYIINYLYDNFPKTKVAFIITHQVYATNFYQFMDKAREICKKWSVPVIDLFNEGNLNFQISYMRTRYSLNADGLHPNLDGYEIETPFVENSIKYKI